jgi:hypothetical protein
MPHVNDAFRMSECARLLGGPARLEHVARVNGRRIIDTADPGQQEFQALLLWCLLSPARSLPWDIGVGRSFPDMQLYYSWVSPQHDHLATGWSVAARVASYLLPIIQPAEDGGLRLSGIPGLRFTDAGKGHIRLTHLPTNGVLDLHDYSPVGKDLLTAQLASETGFRKAETDQQKDAHLWRFATLTALEKAELDRHWTLAAQVPVLSAVMARIHLLWRHFRCGAELDLNKVSGRSRISWWDGPSAPDLARQLVDPPLGVPDARWAPIELRGPAIFIIGDSHLELRGPVETGPAGCPVPATGMAGGGGFRPGSGSAGPSAGSTPAAR